MPPRGAATGDIMPLDEDDENCDAPPPALGFIQNSMAAPPKR